MQSNTLPLLLPIILGELLEVEGGLQLSQPLIHLKAEWGDVQKAGESESLPLSENAVV